jgi:hypothetical protein
LTRSATRIDNRALLILLYRSGRRIIEAAESDVPGAC